MKQLRQKWLFRIKYNIINNDKNIMYYFVISYNFYTPNNDKKNLSSLFKKKYRSN